MLRLSRFATAIAATVCFYPCLAGAEVVLKPAKERGAPPEASREAALDAGKTNERKVSLCIESWDAQTHMTKREWRTACRRSVKDYPDSFR